MIATIAAVSLVSFGACYPVLHLLVREARVAPNFYRFNAVMAFLSVGGGCYLFANSPASLHADYLLVLWPLASLFAAGWAWHRPRQAAYVLSLPSLLGLPLLISTLWQVVGGDLLATAMALLGALVLCMTVFATSLGHWYFDGYRLSLKYFYRTVYVLWALLVVRVFSDFWVLLSDTVLQYGEPVRLIELLGHVDGIYLLIGLSLAAVFPLVTMPFIKKTLDAGSNTSATGLLYVALIGVFMGDLGFKYWLVQHGVGL
jgi:hypothetical protein